MTEVSSAATVAAGLDNKPGSVGMPHGEHRGGGL